MSAKPLILHLPDALARELESANQGFVVAVLERGLRELRIESALEAYGKGGLSFAAAAGQAGLGQAELARQAYARGLEPPFSADTLAEELAPAP
jgi:hypothetical protein